MPRYFMRSVIPTVANARVPLLVEVCHCSLGAVPNRPRVGPQSGTPNGVGQIDVSRQFLATIPPDICG